jgi:hypothetical protein
MNNLVSDLVFKQLMLDGANQLCLDCNQQQPQWASTSFGVFICLNCASVHRGLGLRVKSIGLDTWDEAHLKLVILGGNQNLKQIFAEFDLLDEPAAVKYKTVIADYYRNKLRSIADDQELLTEKPEYLTGKTILNGFNEDCSPHRHKDDVEAVDFIKRGVDVSKSIVSQVA